MDNMNAIRPSSEWLSLISAAGILFSVSVISCGAQSYTEAIRDTSLQFNLDGSSGGLSDWTIDGVNQLQSQWFYYSIGSAPVYAINNLATWTTPTVSTNLGKTQITLSESYVNPA